MGRILSFVDATSAWTGRVVSTLSLVTALFVTYEIVLRDFYTRPTVWAAEGTVFACGLLYLLGGAWTLLEDRHVRVDVLYSRISDRNRALLDALTYLCFSLYVVAMIWATAKYALESVQLRETTMSPWDPPIWPMKVAMLLALLLLFTQGTVKFIRNLHLVFTGRVL